MDATYHSLSQRIIRQFALKESEGQNRLLVALAGPPGSGKSTIAAQVVQQVASMPSGPSIVAVSVDGFHLSRATLRSLPNATEALARRGAPWTFDSAAAAKLVQRLRDGAGKYSVTAPTFDHAVKDPVPDDLMVGPHVQVCILEGNYLLSDEEPWGGIASIVDECWLIKVDTLLARSRVAERHLKSGIEDTMEKALKRANENDLVNGEYVIKHSEGRRACGPPSPAPTESLRREGDNHPNVEHRKDTPPVELSRHTATLNQLSL
ncbi:P-loop containing nucleoside triphosphate hydrolase protein [Ilyonectria destructans]|nr:P-loop containing nucleoside triphosphate hydrolase protein [Ilyonectria destructans]